MKLEFGIGDRVQVMPHVFYKTLLATGGEFSPPHELAHHGYKNVVVTDILAADGVTPAVEVRDDSWPDGYIDVVPATVVRKLEPEQLAPEAEPELQAANLPG